MKTRQEVIKFCLSISGTYEDYPFHDDNWTIMRHIDNKKMFAAIFQREGYIWVNLKCEPLHSGLLRSVYTSVIPAYHMNKEHWNSVILDGSIPENEIINMIMESLRLTAKKEKNKKMKGEKRETNCR